MYPSKLLNPPFQESLDMLNASIPIAANPIYPIQQPKDYSFQQYLQMPQGTTYYLPIYGAGTSMNRSTPPLLRPILSVHCRAVVPTPSAEVFTTRPPKRRRRRYEEIERLYVCGYQGCDKAYGTLNHLNIHVDMQAHGVRRKPEEFKNLRKQWRQWKVLKEDPSAHSSSITSTSYTSATSSIWGSAILPLNPGEGQ